MTSPPRQRRTALLAVGAVGLLIAVLGIVFAFIPDDRPGVVEPAWLNDPLDGKVRYCTGEDLSRSQEASVRDFNERFGQENGAVLVELSATANGQFAEYKRILRADAESQCDIVYLDVIHMPYFATKNLLYDMTPYLQQNNRIGEFDDTLVKTIRYEDKFWGVPKQLDAGVLFYRTDKGLRPPRSWPDLFEQARPRNQGEKPRLRFQAAGYEGLTVVFLELAYSAGARPIISSDGKRADIYQEPAVRALAAMRNAIGRALPKEAINQADKGSLSIFEHGGALFMRSWPFAAARIHRDADIAERNRKRDAVVRRQAADNFKVVPLPPWTPGGDHVGILGGHDLVIPRNARNPRGALRLIDFLTSFSQVRQDAREYAQVPVLKSVASDPDVKNETIPAIRRTRIEERPLIANYDVVSQIISSGLSEALQKKKQIRTALIDINRCVQEALQSSEAGIDEGLDAKACLDGQ